MLRFLPDALYCRLVFLAKFRRFPRLERPLSFADALYWYRTKGGLETYSEFVDKLAVRSYVSRVVGERYLNEIICVPDVIDSDLYRSLPSSFVMKLNNGSGFNLVVKDKARVSWQELRAVSERWMRSNYYRLTREIQYRGVRNRIFFERYLDDGKNEALLDYKVYCINGVVKLIQVLSERRGSKVRHAYYDESWNRLSVWRNGFEPGGHHERPAQLECLVELARDLSMPFRFVRVDFYVVADEIYFGELTFLPANGNLEFMPAHFDEELARALMN